MSHNFVENANFDVHKALLIKFGNEAAINQRDAASKLSQFRAIKESIEESSVSKDQF